MTSQISSRKDILKKPIETQRSIRNINTSMTQRTGRELYHTSRNIGTSLTRNLGKSLTRNIGTSLT